MFIYNSWRNYALLILMFWSVKSVITKCDVSNQNLIKQFSEKNHDTNRIHKRNKKIFLDKISGAVSKNSGSTSKWWHAVVRPRRQVKRSSLTCKFIISTS